MQIRKLIVATLGLVVALGAHAAMPSNAGKARQVLTVSQKVSETNLVAVTAKVAPLVNSTSGYGSTVLRTEVRLPTAIGSIQPPTFTAGMSESQILAKAKQHFKDNGAALAPRMSEWMRKQGVSFAWFTFEQKLFISYPKTTTSTSTTNATRFTRYMAPVDPEGIANAGTNAGSLAPGVEERLLIWSMSTDHRGRAMFGNPKIVPPKPKTLYVVYTPLTVDDNLPSEWKYPNAGTLFVQTRDENFAVLPGTDERIDVQGAFDESPEMIAAGDDPEAASAFNPNSKINCLMDHTKPGCTNTISVRSLMDERGATLAVVDYIRKVQPVYDEVSPGVLVPQVTLNIDTRRVNYSGCSDATYYNHGSYGYRLLSGVTRFLVGPDGEYSPIGESQLEQQSPTKVYEGMVTVPSPQLPLLPSHVINPASPNSPQLVAVSELPISSLAGLQETGEQQSVIAYNVSPQLAVRVYPQFLAPTQPRQVHVYLACDGPNNTLKFSAGFQDVGVDERVDWSTTVNQYTTGATFVRGQPASKAISTIAVPGYGYACTGTVSYNGSNSVSFNLSEDCPGGKSLHYGNIYTDDLSVLYANYDPNDFQRYAHNGLRSLVPGYCPAGSYYGTVGGDMWKKTWYGSGSLGGGTWATEMVASSKTGCVYDDRTGLNIDYYQLKEEGPHDQMQVPSGFGMRDSPWTGSCPDNNDFPLFNALNGTPAEVSYGYYPPASYTRRTCVKVPLPTWTFNF